MLVAVLSVASACSLLAPSEEDFYGGARPTQSGGTSGNDGGATAGDGASGAQGERGGVSSAGEGGVAGSGAHAGEPGATGGVVGGGAAGTAGDGGGAEPGGRDGSAGAAGAEPTCAMECGVHEKCVATATGAACACVDGFVREGTTCRLPRSCNELHGVAPELASGPYTLQPLGATASFQAYCGMMLEGGGWTLVVNEGPSFDPNTMGLPSELCYSSACTNLGYSQVLLDSDVMIDMSNAAIVNATYTARVIVTGVHAMSRGKTLRTLFTTGPNYVDLPDNSNVAVRMIGGAECSTLPADMAALVCPCSTADCKSSVMVFGDNDSAAGCRTTPAPRFAIGAAYDYMTSWGNCAGWPQDPNYVNADFYPDYIRVWLR